MIVGNLFSNGLTAILVRRYACGKRGSILRGPVLHLFIRKNTQYLHKSLQYLTTQPPVGIFIHLPALKPPSQMQNQNKQFSKGLSRPCTKVPPRGRPEGSEIHISPFGHPRCPGRDWHSLSTMRRSVLEHNSTDDGLADS